MTAARYWTQSAIDCYKRGCTCSNCYLKETFSKYPLGCQMKATVRELVRKFGTPKDPEISAEKTCINCGITKPIEDFHGPVNKWTLKFICHSYCKECKKEKDRLYREKKRKEYGNTAL